VVRDWSGKRLEWYDVGGEVVGTEEEVRRSELAVVEKNKNPALRMSGKNVTNRIAIG
jgi:hypothetical protein